MFAASQWRLALRVLLRRKAFTAISLFSIAMTLATLLVAASLLDDLFGGQAPELNQERRLGVYRLRLESDHSTSTTSPGYGFLERYVKSLQTPQLVSIVADPAFVAVYAENSRAKLYAKYVDGEFWEMMQFTFLAGAPFTRDDEREGRRLAVINRATQTALFAGDLAVGKSIEVAGESFTVVGVVENTPFHRHDSFADIWLPHGARPSSDFRRDFTGRHEGLILAHDRADLDAIRREFREKLQGITLPGDYKLLVTAAETRLESVTRELLSSDGTTAHPRLFMAMLIVAALLFMILPAITLTNLAVSRMVERSTEIGVRKAFGASWRALVGQLLLENLLLTLLGGGLSLLLARAVLQLFNQSTLIPYARFGINWRIFLIGLVAAVIFSLLSGGYPAWRMSRLHPAAALQGRAV